MKFNILLISYNFPPIEGPRSLRWIQFTKYLVRKGYKIDVLTIDPEMSYGGYEKESIKMIPIGVNVCRTYPGLIYKFKYRYLPSKEIKNQKNYKTLFKAPLREMMKIIYQGIVEPILIPDNTIEWLPWGLGMVKKLIQENHYNLIISSAPPFTGHILAYFAKRKTGIPWIADYGDPWVFYPVPKIMRHHLVSKWIESMLIKEMDYIIVTTNETKEGFVKYYPFLKKERIRVISQGYDPEEFKRIRPELGNKFRIVYTGFFYDHIREPYTFFDAIKGLKDIELEVIVAGNIHSHHIKAAEEKGVIGKVIFLGYQLHERVIALQKGADLLLLLSNNSPYQLPGKIFEYFAASRPILVIRFVEKDIATRLIEKYSRGVVVSAKPEEIVSAIKKIYALWQKGKLDKQFQLKPMGEYSWEYQVEKLENVIKNVISN